MAEYYILVVDDEEGIRSGTRRILQPFVVDFPFMEEQVTYRIGEAGSAEEAIPMLEQAWPDIVLLDNKLPGMEGIELLEYIRRKGMDTMVVMITSYASLELAVKATQDGAFDFIPKPFTPAELRSSVESITKKLFLRRMTRKLNKEGRQIRFQFLAVLSHELKAPLNALEGYLRLLKEREFGEQMEGYDATIDRMEARIRSMRTLILDLLDLTRIESGKAHRNIGEVDLGVVAQNAIDTIRPYAIQRDIDIQLTCPARATILADTEEVEIIMNNLLSNAVKYNLPRGRVNIRISEGDDSTSLEVEDTGIGMTSEECGQLFGDFVRLKNPRSGGVGGSGLGLSIVKKILDLYDARIEVESEPEKGSTFRVDFYKDTSKSSKP